LTILDHSPESILVDNANCVDFSARKVSFCSLYIDNGVIKAKMPTHGPRPRAARNIDLHGQYIIPSFIDCHTHLISSGIEMQRLDLSHCRSLDDCLQKISAQAKTRALVFASNWDENSWRYDERDRLTRKILDRISRKNPIIMRRICGHYAVANTPALRRIAKHWSIVDRRHGFLYENVALNLNDIFIPTDEMLEKALVLATKKALRLGITSVHEISNPRRFRLLQKHQKDLKVRFAVYLTAKYHPKLVASGLRTGYGDDWLRFAGTKIFIDGSIGARTAALRQTYENTRRRGKILFSARRLDNMVRSAERNGIQLMIHSIGDRSTALVLDILGRNLVSRNPLRHRLEHLEILEDDAIRVIGRLSIIASMQPNFVRRWQNPRGMYSKIIGSKYLSMNCFRSLIKARARVVFGSDCMPLGPLYGIEGAVWHPSICGRLDIADAFRLYTESGAYATFEENRKGKIEPGYFADLVVFNKNPLEKKNLTELKIQSVMVGGSFVKQR
jgi:predicted amidohydrolase YtcJ